MKFPITLVALLLLAPSVRAQEPIIVETSAPPRIVSRPKPKPRPEPTFTKPHLLWKTQLGRIDGTPLVNGDNIYVGVNNSLVALDTDGRTQWTSDTGAIQASPSCDEKNVYVGTARGIFYALERTTGTVVWKFVTDGNAALFTSPVVAVDRIFFEGTDNNVYSLSRRNGQFKWKVTRPDGSLGYSSPIVDADAIVVSGEAALYRLDAATGKQLWKAFIGGKSLSSPAAAAGHTIIGGDGSGVTSIDLKDGTLLWTFKGKSEGDWFGPSLLAGGTAYISTFRHFVYALDSSTGRQKWSARVMGSALGQPAYDSKRGVVYITSTTFADSPTITALDAHTGRKLWDYAAGSIGGSPVIIGDRLYVGTTSGYLYAFSLK